jgi:catechol 2,3-dioxygenase-like lactoylglutathione lyase family enzyme
MTNPQISSTRATKAPVSTVVRVDEKLEVIAIPVADVDRAKRFYEGMGWRLDADLRLGSGGRVVQLTPPGSQCSIQFGTGITKATPGTAQGTILVVYDIEVARAQLIDRGVVVSEVFHIGEKGPEVGPDPQGRSYFSRASFADPDGNRWVLQEVRTRIAGRVEPGPIDDALTDATTLTELLRETEMRHGAFEATAPKHHWSNWYAAYLIARAHGRTADEASRDAALHVSRV